MHRPSRCGSMRFNEREDMRTLVKVHSNLFSRHEGCVNLTLTGVAEQDVRGTSSGSFTPLNCSVKSAADAPAAGHIRSAMYMKAAFSCPEKRSPWPLLLPPYFFSANRRVALGRGCGFVSEREYQGRPGRLEALTQLVMPLTGASDHLRLN